MLSKNENFEKKGLLNKLWEFVFWFIVVGLKEISSKFSSRHRF